MRRASRAAAALLLLTLLGRATPSAAAPASPEPGPEGAIAASLPPPGPTLATIAPAAAAPPRVGWAVTAGVATALAPMIVGSLLLASGPREVQYAGIFVLHAGLVAAPFAALGVTREWKRAAAWSAVAFGAAAINALAIGLEPMVLEDPAYRLSAARVTVGVMLAISVGAATGAIVDSARAGERAARRATPSSSSSPPPVRVVLSPFFPARGAGLALGGVF